MLGFGGLLDLLMLIVSPPLPVLLPTSAGQGLQISAQLTRRDGQVFYSLLFENNSQSTLDGFMIQFNKNSFGLAAAGPLQVVTIDHIDFVDFLRRFWGFFFLALII